jgi:hypothetical protein
MSMTGTGSDDSQWRRPGGEQPARAPRAEEFPAPYTGPPRTLPPPPDWRPKLLVQPPPPRTLPKQDMATLDAQEKEERTLTYGIGMVAGAILLVVLLILCGRAFV